MFKFNNDTHKIKNSCLAMAIAIGGGFAPASSYACLPPAATDFLGMAGGIFGTVFAPGLGTAIGTAAGNMAGSALGCSGGGSAGAGGGAVVDSGAAVKEVLQKWLEDNKNAREEQRRLVNDILQMNAQQMTQLLQMHQEEFTKLVAMNENQRKDFIAELDKQRDSFERIIDKINEYAAQGRVLDHATIIELITGSRQEREAMYQRHKDELDRLITEYNSKLSAVQAESAAKVTAAQAERDAAVNKVTDMLASLNRQLIMAQVLHVNCSRAIDDYTFCTMIRYRHDLEKCAQKANVKSIACFE